MKSVSLLEETVLSIRHWTDRLFSFTSTRNTGFRFENGQFTMLGLMVDGRPLLRAYSIASANHADDLEFLSVKVEGGPLTSRLKSVVPGDQILLGRKPTGTLVVDYLLPGRRLYLVATGTGLAPFLSIIRDPFTYELFERIILVHGVRHVADLAYRNYITDVLPKDEFLGDLARSRLTYHPTVTREAFCHRGRVTELIENRTLEKTYSLPLLNTQEDRLMICGNAAMLYDLTRLLEGRGFVEGNARDRGSFVVEKAFVEK